MVESEARRKVINNMQRILQLPRMWENKCGFFLKIVSIYFCKYKALAL